MGRCSFRPWPSVSWMELDEGLYADVCFAKGNPLLVRPLKKPAHSRSKGSLISPGAQDGQVSESLQNTGSLMQAPLFARPSQWSTAWVRGPGSCRKDACVGPGQPTPPGDSTPLSLAEGLPVRGPGSSGLFRPQWCGVRLRWAELIDYP